LAYVNSNCSCRLIFVNDVPEASSTTATDLDHGLASQVFLTTENAKKIIVHLILEHVLVITILIQIDTRITEQGITIVEDGDLRRLLSLEGRVVEILPDNLLEGTRVKEEAINGPAEECSHLRTQPVNMKI
jgi:hypothetical protein